VRVDGKALDLGGVRPRQLQLLQLLALHGGRVVHRELLVEWQWPTLGAARGAHSLQVAVSALRRLAGDEAVTPLVVRERDGYRLALGPHDRCDVRDVEAALDEARRLLRQGDADGATRAYGRVVDLSTGDLLPAAGPEDWVAEARDRLRLAFGEACQHVADELASRGRHRDAARVAQQGLERVPSQDGLWRQAIAALEAGGDHAAGQRTRARYEELLDELGLSGHAGAPR
jgi:DNA-binding SARP family transcriptional activator